MTSCLYTSFVYTKNPKAAKSATELMSETIRPVLGSGGAASAAGAALPSSEGGAVSSAVSAPIEGIHEANGSLNRISKFERSV